MANRSRTLHRALEPLLEKLEERQLFGDAHNYPAPPPAECDISEAPINYSSGTPYVASTDLSSNAFGRTFGQTRQWTGVNDSGPTGNGWAVQSLGYLQLKRNEWSNGSGIVTAVLNGGASMEFVSDVSLHTFKPRYGEQASLVYAPPDTDGSGNVPGYFTLTDSEGSVTTFYDLPRDPAQKFTDNYVPLKVEVGHPQAVSDDWYDSSGNAGSTAEAYRFGAFRSHVDASGKLTTTATYDADANLDAVTRTDGNSAFERFDYTFTAISNDANNDSTFGGSGDREAYFLSSVVLERGTGSSPTTLPTTWDKVRSVSYQYYDGFDDGAANGRFGDLKLVTIKDKDYAANPSDTHAPIEQKYYRFNQLSGKQYLTGSGQLSLAADPGSASGGIDATYPPISSDNMMATGLESVFEGASFGRLLADHSSLSAIEGMSDTEIAGYSQYVFRYERFEPGDIGYGEVFGNETRYRVIQEMAAAEGCSTCSDGFGIYRFDYKTLNGGNNRYDTAADLNTSLDRPSINEAGLRTIEYLSDTTNSMPVAITSGNLGFASTTATVTFPSAHEFEDGQRVLISGSGLGNQFFGTFVIDVQSSTTFTYTMTGVPSGVPSAGVTVTNLDAGWSDNDQHYVYTNERGNILLKAVREVATANTITARDDSISDYSLFTIDGHGFEVGDLIHFSGDTRRNDYRTTVVAVIDADTIKVEEYTGPVSGVIGGGPATHYTKAIRERPTYHRFDRNGREIWTASPSAITGWSEVYADLLNVTVGVGATYLHSDAGRIDITEYGADNVNTSGYGDGSSLTSTSHGEVGGYIKSIKISRGMPDGIDAFTGANVTTIKDRTYYKMTANGASIYPLATETLYWDVDADGVLDEVDDESVTSFIYTRFSNGSPTNRIESMTKRLPAVATTRHGDGSTPTTMGVYDAMGRRVWFRDADSFISFTKYGASGGIERHITDVDTDNTGHFTDLPSGWSNPDGLHLKTDMVQDGLGRTTKLVDPRMNVTWTVYRDAEHEVRTYAGWNSTTGTALAPTSIVRQDWGQRYQESLTMSATPATGGSSGNLYPLGTESVGTVHTLTRQLLNDAGQIIEVDRYFSMPGGGYSTSTSLGTSSSDSSTGNYHATIQEYGPRGQLKRIVSPTGTITRYTYDARKQLVGKWVGTDDTPTSGFWSPANTVGTNLTQTEVRSYDANGNLRKVDATYITTMYYDYRDRLVATKSGDTSGTQGAGAQRQITYYTLDNASHVVSTSTYDGDNISLTYTDGVPNAPSSSLLRSQNDQVFDDRGRLYKSVQRFVDSGGNVSTTKMLSAGYWYDDRGNVIKQTSPGAAARKNTYDGAGRLLVTYVTDAADDTSVPGSDAPDTVNSDTVLEESHYTYDANGNVTLTRTRQRYAGATDDDALGGPSASSGTAKSRDYYTASYYDSVNRLTRSINLGTNGNSAYTSYSSDATASRSNDKLITDYEYDGAGRLWRTTNPRNIDSVTYYDLMGRTTKTIDARKDFDVGSGTDYDVRDGNNRTTTYTYNGLGNVLSLKAMTPDGSDTDTLGGYQETLYVYGVGVSSGSAIESNDLLREVHYPAKTLSSGNLDAFAADSGEADAYAYNALGEKIGYTDRRGVVHEYSYDVVGRMTADAVLSLPSSVDNAVTDIIYTFDSAGRRYQVSSYDSSAAIKSRVQYEYNGFGQLVTEYQSHGGSVNTSTTPKVQYAYSEDGTNNHSRPTSVTYPNGRTISYDYASGLDDTISRLSATKEGSTTLEAYKYLGLGTFVTLDRVAANSQLTYGTDGDAYAGLDRFGRIVDQKWQTNDSVPSILDDTQYSYDRNGNRTKANVVTGGAPTSGQDQVDQMYVYDELDRLVEARRGTINTANSPWTMTNVTELAGWSLDTLGNVKAYMTITDPTSGDANLDGNVDFDDTVINAQNYGLENGLWTQSDFDGDGVVDFDDLVVMSQNYGFTGGNAQTTDVRAHNGQNQLETMNGQSLLYDDAGSQIEDQNGYTTTYDAWNRPIEVKNGSTTLTSYQYDGLGRRIVDGGVHQYFNSGWQLVETRASTSGAATASYVWSPVYIDALIARDLDLNGDADFLDTNERVYSQWDANFNVTSVVDENGDVIERYRYEAYGARTVLNTDFSVDTLAGSDSTTGDDSVAGWNKSDVLFLNGHQGGTYDRVLEGEMRFRNRTLDVEQMRWEQVDPLVYVDSANLYCFVVSNPMQLVDPLGRRAEGSFWPGLGDFWDKLFPDADGPLTPTAGPYTPTGEPDDGGEARSSPLPTNGDVVQAAVDKIMPPAQGAIDAANATGQAIYDYSPVRGGEIGLQGPIGGGPKGDFGVGANLRIIGVNATLDDGFDVLGPELELNFLGLGDVKGNLEGELLAGSKGAMVGGKNGEYPKGGFTWGFVAFEWDPNCGRLKIGVAGQSVILGIPPALRR